MATYVVKMFRPLTGSEMTIVVDAFEACRVRHLAELYLPGWRAMNFSLVMN